MAKMATMFIKFIRRIRVMFNIFKKTNLGLIGLAFGISLVVGEKTEATCASTTADKAGCIQCCSQKPPNQANSCKRNCKDAKKARKADKKAAKRGGQPHY
jgi:hypothetical protein